MNAIVRTCAWATIAVGVALFVALAPEVPRGGIVNHVPSESDYMLALVPIEAASAAVLPLIAVGPIRSSVFGGRRRAAFWLATAVIVAFWVSFYADWFHGVFHGRLALLVFA